MKQVNVLELRKNLAGVVAPLKQNEYPVCLVMTHGQPYFGLTTLQWTSVIAEAEVCDQGGTVLSAEEINNIFLRISGSFAELGQKLSVEQLVAEFVRQARIVSDFNQLQEKMKKSGA